MVLCAGFGTGLRPLTDRVPKPLVPLCGVPLLRYNFALLKNAGVREIVINTHHLGATMARGAQAIASELELDLQVSREEKQILGTGGGVRRAQAMLGAGTFILMNGDMIFDLDLADALAAHRKAGAGAVPHGSRSLPAGSDLRGGRGGRADECPPCRGARRAARSVAVEVALHRSARARTGADRAAAGRGRKRHQPDRLRARHPRRRPGARFLAAGVLGRPGGATVALAGAPGRPGEAHSAAAVPAGSGSLRRLRGARSRSLRASDGAGGSAAGRG